MIALILALLLLAGAVGCSLESLYPGRHMGRKLFFSAIGLIVFAGAYTRYEAGAVAGLALWLGWVWWSETTCNGTLDEVVVDDDEPTVRD